MPNSTIKLHLFRRTISASASPLQCTHTPDISPLSLSLSLLPPSACADVVRNRTQTLRRHAEQKVRRAGCATNVWRTGRHRGVHRAARPERPEQRLRVRHVRQQAIGDCRHQGKCVCAVPHGEVSVYVCVA